MIRLKNLLQSNLIYFILIIVTLIYSFFIIEYDLYNYKLNNKHIVGKIIEIDSKNNYNSIKLRLGVNKIIIVNDYSKDKLEIGDIIKVKGKIITPNNNTNFHLFNYQKYLRSNHIFYIIKAKKIIIIKTNILTCIPDIANK